MESSRCEVRPLEELEEEDVFIEGDAMFEQILRNSAKSIFFALDFQVSCIECLVCVISCMDIYLVCINILYG
jgi:hypothetical protein